MCVSLSTTLKIYADECTNVSGCITLYWVVTWKKWACKEKKIFFLCHSVRTFSGKKCTSSNFFFFHFFFDPRKQVEQVISFYIHFSSSHFLLLLFFFIFHFLSEEDEQYIQHIYWKGSIWAWACTSTQRCVTVLSNQWRFIYVVGIISRLCIEI